MNYKAIVCDVDDTLIVSRRNALPSKRVIKAIKKTQEKGVIFSLATGRSLTYVKPLINLLQLHHPLIIEGGATIYHPKKKKVLWQSLLAPKTVSKIFAILSQKPYSFVVNAHLRRYVSPKKRMYKRVTRFIWYDIPTVEARRLKSELSEISGISVLYASSWSGKDNIDIHITNQNATKQHALLQLAQILIIHPQEIIGVGDHENDLPLLLACGLKVAMGNAVPNLKAIADYIAPTLEKDGVVDVIEKFVNF